MKLKKKTKCSECSRMVNNIYGPNIDLCRRCLQKSQKQRIPNGPMIYKEEITTQTTINFGLTETQKKQISKRLDKLYPGRNKYRELNKLALYVRGLIVEDLEKSGCYSESVQIASQEEKK